MQNPVLATVELSVCLYVRLSHAGSGHCVKTTQARIRIFTDG